MGDSPWGPRGAPEDHGWGKGLHWSEGIKKKKNLKYTFFKRQDRSLGSGYADLAIGSPVPKDVRAQGGPG